MVQRRLESKAGHTTEDSVDTPWDARKDLIFKSPLGNSVRGGMAWRTKVWRPSEAKAQWSLNADRRLE